MHSNLESDLTNLCLWTILHAGCLTDSTPKEVHQTLDPENGLDRGDWGPVDLCPDGTTVHSFEFKVPTYSFLEMDRT